uniref:Ras-related protein Rab-33 n=1 Tax=Romanomermis culicivorax TaxID=13658 RepID=A0A915IU27_ROMCU
MARNPYDGTGAPIPYALGDAKVHLQKGRRTFKVIVVGDSNVGKTCLSFRFCNGRFPQYAEATIGVDFRERSVNIDGDVLKIQLWDTAGQERFRQSIVSHYYRNVNAVVYVYDMTRSTTFRNLVRWINECKENGVGDDVPKILIGNKCDMEPNSVEVTSQEALKFADQNDMPCFETSAKSDSQSDHVESIFMTLVYKLKNCKQMHVTGKEAEKDANCEHNITLGDQKKKIEDNYCC